MARKRSILEYIALFFAFIVVLTPARLIVGGTYGPLASGICNIFWYVAILGFLGCVFYGVYRIVTKGERKR
jgi:hypothetical protein